MYVDRQQQAACHYSNEDVPAVTRCSWRQQDAVGVCMCCCRLQLNSSISSCARPGKQSLMTSSGSLSRQGHRSCNPGVCDVCLWVGCVWWAADSRHFVKCFAAGDLIPACDRTGMGSALCSSCWTARTVRCASGVAGGHLLCVCVCVQFYCTAVILASCEHSCWRRLRPPTRQSVKPLQRCTHEAQGVRQPQ